MSGQPELTAQETQQGRRGREERFNPIILRGYWSAGTGLVESLRLSNLEFVYFVGRNRAGRPCCVDRQVCVCMFGVYGCVSLQVYCCLKRKTKPALSSHRIYFSNLQGKLVPAFRTGVPLEAKFVMCRIRRTFLAA